MSFIDKFKVGDKVIYKPSGVKYIVRGFTSIGSLILEQDDQPNAIQVSKLEDSIKA